eukprot:UN08056
METDSRLEEESLFSKSCNNFSFFERDFLFDRDFRAFFLLFSYLN